MPSGSDQPHDNGGAPPSFLVCSLEEKEEHQGLLVAEATPPGFLHNHDHSHFFSDRWLSHIPMERRIRVLYADASVVVVDKPCNLRSVPGFAESRADDPRGAHNTNTTTTTTTITTTSPTNESVPASSVGQETASPAVVVVVDDKHDNISTTMSPRRSPLDAWILALQSFRDALDHDPDDNDPDDNDTTDDDSQSTTMALSASVRLVLSHMASHKPSHWASIPRKATPFRRYLHKNAKRFGLRAESFPPNPLTPPPSLADMHSTKATLSNDGGFHSAFWEQLADAVLDLLQRRQRFYQNLPSATPPEDSVLGQVGLLLRGTVHAVHRLDCETSGLMVVARTCEAAQALSKAWRERRVTKTYRAMVHNWPTEHVATTGTTTTVPPGNDGDNDDEGRIDLPLRASTEERLKWVVDLQHGKPSTTLWKVLPSWKERPSDAVHLELVPITGRTHQLRVHCAVVGGGIRGDSLYGISAQQNFAVGETLKLHAYHLNFPHPSDGRPMAFTLPPSW